MISLNGGKLVNYGDSTTPKSTKKIASTQSIRRNDTKNSKVSKPDTAKAENTKFPPNGNLIYRTKNNSEIPIRSQVKRFVVGTDFNLFVTASFSFTMFPGNAEKKIL